MEYCRVKNGKNWTTYQHRRLSLEDTCGTKTALSSKVDEDSEALIKEEQELDEEDERIYEQELDEEDERIYEQELDEEDERIYEQRYSTELDMNAKLEKMEDDVYNLKKGWLEWRAEMEQYFSLSIL